jgi:hypothetical protein
MTVLFYPFLVLRFWYREGLFALFAALVSYLSYFTNLLSLPLLIKTFFKPLKNEYRKGLVGFSIGMGIFVKTALILLDLLLLLLFFLFEVLIFLGFLLLPLAAVLVLFI